MSKSIAIPLDRYNTLATAISRSSKQAGPVDGTRLLQSQGVIPIIDEVKPRKSRVDQLGGLATLIERLRNEKAELEANELHRWLWIEEQSAGWFSVASYSDIMRIVFLDELATEQDVKDAFGGGYGHNADSDEMVSAMLFGEDHEYREGDFQKFASVVADLYAEIERDLEA